MRSADRTRVLVFFLFFIALLVFAVVYTPTSAFSHPSASILPVGKPLQVKAPLGLPPVPIPADNPPTAETVALGRILYYDPVLSADSTV